MKKPRPQVSCEQMIIEIEKSEPKPDTLKKTDHGFAAYGTGRKPPCRKK